MWVPWKIRHIYCGSMIYAVLLPFFSGVSFLSRLVSCWKRLQASPIPTKAGLKNMAWPKPSVPDLFSSSGAECSWRRTFPGSGHTKLGENETGCPGRCGFDKADWCRTDVCYSTQLICFRFFLISTRVITLGLSDQRHCLSSRVEASAAFFSPLPWSFRLSPPPSNPPWGWWSS